MNRIDDIFNVGYQHSLEGGDWVSRHGCIKCGQYADRGSWCRWHHPVDPAPPLVGPTYA